MIRVLINKFTFMKDSKQSFKDLVKKMDSLEETQQGKLKGGFTRSRGFLIRDFLYFITHNPILKF
jgi:hypothetical protein